MYRVSVHTISLCTVVVAGAFLRRDAFGSMEGRPPGDPGGDRGIGLGIDNTFEDGADPVSSSSAVSGDTRSYTTGTASHSGCQAWR